MNNQTPTILRKIIARKKEEVAERKRRIPVEEMRESALHQMPARGFYRALAEKVASGSAAVIAELKKASPSKGIIREDFDPVKIAKSYEKGGACCLSVLTDEDFFQGSDNYLKMARNASSLPVLRKDFTIDAYQVFEARALGADCVLLIVAALEEAKLIELHDLGMSLGLDVLVEVHNAAELERALRLENTMVGINNRDLHSFETSLATTYELLDYIPPNRLVITESGINTTDDVAAMRGHNVNAFLVGEAFMRYPEPGSRLLEMFH